MNNPPKQPPKTLTTLPTELHLQISTYLPYPDALALKHTSRHFYALVYTGVHLKVDWFVERFEQKLECPMEKCSFRTDEAFCNLRIRRIMERRRRHLEWFGFRSWDVVFGGLFDLGGGVWVVFSVIAFLGYFFVGTQRGI
ncbi:hypothetical protein AFLA_002183 [Aspergillus flavus NRRL3357]|nr:hypothetical protein AFLA_002183 [Aspergillus flavus NRRL3357]